MTNLETQDVSRISRKKKQTRQKLMDAAMGLIIEKGYEDVMTDEITDLADVGRRTFYNYFDNKRSCVVAAIKHQFKTYADEVDSQAHQARVDLNQAPTGDKKALAIMASHMFQLIANDPITLKLSQHPDMLNEAITESQRDSMMANVAKGVMSGAFQPSLPVNTLEPIISWGFMGLMFESIARGTQIKDSYEWAHFVLKNLGINDIEIMDLISDIKTLNH